MPADASATAYALAFGLGLLMLFLLQRLLGKSEAPRRPRFLTLHAAPNGLHHVDGEMRVAGPLHAHNVLLNIAASGNKGVVARVRDRWVVVYGRQLAVVVADPMGQSQALLYVRASAPGMLSAAPAPAPAAAAAVRRFESAEKARAAIPPGGEAQHAVLYNGPNDPTYYLVDTSRCAVDTSSSPPPQ